MQGISGLPPAFFIAMFLVAVTFFVYGAFRAANQPDKRALGLVRIFIPLLVAVGSASQIQNFAGGTATAAPSKPDAAAAPANAPADEMASARAPATLSASVPATATGSGPAADTAPGAGAPPAAGTAPAANGKAIYAGKCASCHAPTGLGLPGAFPPIAGAEIANGPADDHIKAVVDGLTGPIVVKGKKFNGVMPPWKDLLSAEEIAAVVTYERTAFGNAGGAVTVDQVVKLGGKK